LLKNNATSDGIAAVKGGLDLCFASKTRAERFVQLVSELSPVRIKSSSKTRSEDLSQHTANVQTTYCVELCPSAQYDLVLLPKKLVQSLGVPRVAVCTQTAGQLHFVDPTSGKAFDLSRDRYWQLEFPPWETSANLAEFVVLDIEEPERSSSKDGAARSGARDVEVARVRDFGVNDVTFIVRSHLADELEVGDHVKGYDIASANVRTYIAYSLDQSDMPEIVLVRSTVGDKAADGSEDAETVALKRLVDDSDGYKTGKAEAREFDAFAADWADEQQQLALAA
jgi:nonsense-mediated mRNA decay protein 3